MKLTGRQEIAEKMLRATKPAQFKALGRKVKGFDEKKWNKSEDLLASVVLSSVRDSPWLDKFRIVEEGNWLKFTKSKEYTELSKKLLETAEREIVEVRKASK